MRLTLFALCITCLVAAAVLQPRGSLLVRAQAAGLPQSDEFDAPGFTAPFRLQCGYLASATCPDASGPNTWSLGNGLLEISPMYGELYGTAAWSNIRNMVLQPFDPGLDWTVTTKIAFSGPNDYPPPGGPGAGLVVYQDDAHYMYLARSFNPQYPFVWFQEGDNERTQIPADASRLQNSGGGGAYAYLRIVKTGAYYQPFVSFDGVNFQPITWSANGQEYTAGFTASFSTPSVGLFAMGGPKASPSPASFDWFRVSAPGNPTPVPTLGPPTPSPTLSVPPPPSACTSPGAHCRQFAFTPDAEAVGIQWPWYAYDPASGSYSALSATPSTRSPDCAGFWGDFGDSGAVNMPNPTNPGETASCTLRPGANLIGNPLHGPADLPSGVVGYQWNGTGYDTVSQIPAAGAVWILNSGAQRTILLTAAGAPPMPTPTGTTPAPTPAPRPSHPLVVPKTTKVLTQSALRYVKLPRGKHALNTRAGKLTLVFRKSPPSVLKLRPGDVITAGVTPETPYGMMRKVISVHHPRTAVRALGTRQPAAIQAAGLDTETQVDTQSASLRQATGGQPIDILKTVSGFPAAEHTFDLGHGVTAQGSVGITSVDVYFHEDPDGRRFYTTVTPVERASLTVTAKAGVEKDLTKDFAIPIPHGGITVPVAPELGIVIVLTASIEVRVTYSASATITAGLVQNASGSFCAWNDSSGLHGMAGRKCQIYDPVEQLNYHGSDFGNDIHLDPASPSLTLSSSLSASAGPHIQMLVDGAVGPDVGVELKGDFTTSGNQWTLQRSIVFPAKLEANFLVGHVESQTVNLATIPISPTLTGSLGGNVLPTPVPQTVPAAPSDLSVGLANGPCSGEVCTTYLAYTWHDNSSNEDGFRLKITTDGSNTSVITVPRGTSQYTYSVQNGGIVYNPVQVCAVVVAYNAAGESPPSNTVCTQV